MVILIVWYYRADKVIIKNVVLNRVSMTFVILWKKGKNIFQSLCKLYMDMLKGCSLTGIHSNTLSPALK